MFIKLVCTRRHFRHFESNGFVHYSFIYCNDAARHTVRRSICIDRIYFYAQTADIHLASHSDAIKYKKKNNLISASDGPCSWFSFVLKCRCRFETNSTFANIKTKICTRTIHVENVMRARKCKVERKTNKNDEKCHKNKLKGRFLSNLVIPSFHSLPHTKTGIALNVQPVNVSFRNCVHLSFCCAVCWTTDISRYDYLTYRNSTHALMSEWIIIHTESVRSFENAQNTDSHVCKFKKST